MSSTSLLFRSQLLDRTVEGGPARACRQKRGDFEDPSELVVGAIGQVCKLDIPFVHVADATAFAAFDAPGQIKVAWSVRVLPRGTGDSVLELDLRVAATDDQALRRFRRYFRVIGPASRLIRRSLLNRMRRKFGDPDAQENERELASDVFLPDAQA